MRPRANRKLRLLKQNIRSNGYILAGGVVALVVLTNLLLLLRETLLNNSQSAHLFASLVVTVILGGGAGFFIYRIINSVGKYDESNDKQIEQKVQKDDSKYQALIQFSLDLISIIGRDGTISYQSPSSERILGYKPEGLIGTSIYELMHAEDHCFMQNAIDNKAPNFLISYRMQHHDGTWLYFETSGTNMLENPMIGGYIINSRDVTDRKREEEQTRQKEMAALRFNIEKEKAETEKKIIEEKNKEIEKAFQIIKHQNEEITDSINYAFRIQSAIVPAVESIKKVLPNSFVLWRPKDIVSGDFFWFAHKESENWTLLTAADCTGHGVPGAFMTMVGNTLLNQIVLQDGHSMPDDILNNLHKGVRRVLRQDQVGSQSRDGMDITFAAVDHVNKKLHFAAANNPLVFVKNGEYEEFKADKMAIGGLQTEDERIFTLNTIEYNPGDTFYLFSDGYQDQFGGPKGRKFMTKAFKQLLGEISTMDPDSQRERLNKTMIDWIGTDYEQIDDILVIGVRL